MDEPRARSGLTTNQARIKWLQDRLAGMRLDSIGRRKYEDELYALLPKKAEQANIPICEVCNAAMYSIWHLYECITSSVADNVTSVVIDPFHTIHAERGDLDRMTKKPATVQCELAEARRIVSRVIVPPAPLEKRHLCPNGHSPLTACALADSDGRIYRNWWHCQKCGWRSDADNSPESSGGAS